MTRKSSGSASASRAPSLKVDGNPPLDFFKLIARMHAERLRPAA